MRIKNTFAPYPLLYIDGASLKPAFQILDIDPGWCNNSGGMEEEEQQQQQYTGLVGWDLLDNQGRYNKLGAGS